MSQNQKPNMINFLLFGGIGVSILVVAFGIYLMMSGNDSMFSDGDGSIKRIEFSTFIRGEALDDYLICPEDYCTSTRPDAISPEIGQSVNLLRDKLLTFVDSQPNINIHELDPVNQQFTFITHDSSKPFPDVITVRLIALTNNISTMAIYSRTLIGEVRANLNKDRAERWLALLSRD